MCPKPHEDPAILLLTPLTPRKPHFLISWGCLCGSQGSRMWMASFHSAEQMSPCMTGSAPGSRRRTTLATQSPAPQARCTRNRAPKGGGWGGRMIKGAWNCSLGGALCEVSPGSEPTAQEEWWVRRAGASLQAPPHRQKLRPPSTWSAGSPAPFSPGKVGEVLGSWQEAQEEQVQSDWNWIQSE